MSASPSGVSRLTSVAAVLGVLAVTVYALFSVVQIQVLNPLATVPGLSLGEIHAAVGRTADTMGWGLMVAVLLPGPLIAAAAAAAARRGRLSGTALGSIMLGLLAGGSPVHLVASFPAGMTLADTFGVGGADHAPWALLLHVVSLLALLALVLLGIVRAVRAAGISSSSPRTV